MSCVKLPATASNFTSDESALKTLWLMICNIEDKRLAKRAKEGRRVAASAGRLVEGGKVSGGNKPSTKWLSLTRTVSTNTSRNQAPHTNNLTRSFGGGV